MVTMIEFAGQLAAQVQTNPVTRLSNMSGVGLINININKLAAQVQTSLMMMVIYDDL